MKKKRKIVVANWKMAPNTIDEAKKIFSGIRKSANLTKNTDIVVCPSHVHLSVLGNLKIKKPIYLGSQDIFQEENGLFTGQVNFKMVSDAGADFAIVGHSERRSSGDTEEIVNQKLKTVLKSGMKAILCIGEDVRDTEAKYLSFIKNQLESAFNGVLKKYLDNVVIAYEPVWAIGKKDTDAMGPDELHQMSIFIKKVLSDIYKKSNTRDVPVLYGGSVTDRNARDLVQEGEVDGLLVGRASLNVSVFKDLILAVDK